MAVTRLLRPLRRLRPGDRVALVAPAGAVDPERVAGAVEALESRSLRVEVRADISSRHRYLAGSDARRAEELLDALLSPAIGAVFLARGGYGGQRLLRHLAPAAGAPPKPVVGFSDNTALLAHLRQHLGWPCLHGPHPQREKPEELDAVLTCLGLHERRCRPVFEGLRLLGSGSWDPVEGEIAGGCLSLVVSSLGTAHALDFRSRIVFLEETGEPVYRIDRMLHQLFFSGALEGALAVAFGQPETFVPAGRGEELKHLEELLDEFATEAPFPVLTGLPCGHTEPNLPLPIGPTARLEPAEGTLRFLEYLVGEDA